MAASMAAAQAPVLLKEIQTLTFNMGEMSTGRRNPPSPKLTCEFSPNPSLNPTSFQCYNRGINDMGNVQWECKPNNLDNSLKIVKTNVNCEGYNYPEDPYILAGSCILTYSLAYNNVQQQQQQQQGNYYQNQQQQQQQGNYYQGAYYPKEQQKYYSNEIPDNKNYYKSYHPQKKYPNLSYFVQMIIVCCVVGLIFTFILKCISSNRTNNNNNRPRNNSGNDHDHGHGGHYGGGGGSGSDGGHYGGGGGDNNNHGHDYCNDSYPQQRGSRRFGGPFSGPFSGPSVGLATTAAAVGLHVLDRNQEQQNARRRFEYQQQQQNYQPQQNYQSYNQQVPQSGEQRSFADTTRR